MTLITLWILLAPIPASYAWGKGRSGWRIFLLSLALSPLVGMVAAIYIQPRREAASAIGRALWRFSAVCGVFYGLVECAGQSSMDREIAPWKPLTTALAVSGGMATLMTVMYLVGVASDQLLPKLLDLFPGRDRIALSLEDQLRELELKRQRRRRWRAPRAVLLWSTSFLFGSCILGIVTKSIAPSFVDSLPPSGDAVSSNVARVFMVGTIAWAVLAGGAYAIARLKGRGRHATDRHPPSGGAM